MDMLGASNSTNRTNYHLMELQDFICKKTHL